MSRSLLGLLVVVFCACASAVQAGVPIQVVYGRGRNPAAMKLWLDAEKDLQANNVQAALQHADAAIRTDPTLYPAFYTRAKVLIDLGKYDSAVRDCTEALRQDRTFVEAALLRARANAALGRYEDSLKEIDHVVAIRPRQDGLARALNDRAWLRATCPNPSFRNGQQAVKDATTACRLMNWKDEETIDTLAEAYAEAGDFASAVRYEEQALATQGVSPNNATILRRHLEMFKQHRAVRASS